jgi:hypothetical protein
MHYVQRSKLVTEEHDGMMWRYRTFNTVHEHRLRSTVDSKMQRATIRSYNHTNSVKASAQQSRLRGDALELPHSLSWSNLGHLKPSGPMTPPSSGALGSHAAVRSAPTVLRRAAASCTSMGVGDVEKATLSAKPRLPLGGIGIF